MTRRWTGGLLLVAVMLTSAVAHPGVYDDVDKLAKARHDGEPLADARQRWRKGLTTLDAIDPRTLPDLRYCMYYALLEFRLDGPAGAATHRYECTKFLVAGVIGGGAAVPEATARANIINDLSRATDMYYEAEVRRLQRENDELRARLATHQGGTVTIAGARAWISELRQTGVIDGATALTLEGNLGALPDADGKLPPLAPRRWDPIAEEQVDRAPFDRKQR